MRLSGAYGDASGVLVNSLAWVPCLTQGPTLRISNIFADGQPQQASLDYGSISFLINAELGNSAWSTYSWDGALIKIYVGDVGAAWGSYTQIHEGYAGPLSREGQIANVPLQGSEAILDTNLLTSTFAGSGGAEGDANLKGVAKPKAFGACSGIAPVLIDYANQIYQFHDGTANDVVMVYEAGYQINAASSGTVTTYAALAALNLVAGQWAKAPAVGMFRLGGQPKGKISADVQGFKTSGGTYVSTIGTIVPEILKMSGLAVGKIDTTSIGAFTQPWCLYATSQMSVGEAARSALAGYGYLIPSSTGVFKAGNFWNSRTPIALKADRSALPLVRSVKQLAAAPPNYRVKIGANRCWAVHGEAEISEAVKLAGANYASLRLYDQQGGIYAIDGSTITKSGGGGAWNYAAFSYEIYRGGCAVSAVLDTIDTFFGISDGAEYASAYGSLDYAITRNGDGTSWRIVESGTPMLNMGSAYNGVTFSATTQFTIVYDGLAVKYYADGVLMRTVTTTANRSFRAGVACFNVGNKVSSIRFVPSSDNVWANVGGTGRPEDNATVGAPVGTPVGTITAGDVSDTIASGGGLTSEQVTYDAVQTGQLNTFVNATQSGSQSIFVSLNNPNTNGPNGDGTATIVAAPVVNSTNDGDAVFIDASVVVTSGTARGRIELQKSTDNATWTNFPPIGRNYLATSGGGVNAGTYFVSALEHTDHATGTLYYRIVMVQNGAQSLGDGTAGVTQFTVTSGSIKVRKYFSK